MSGSEHSPVKDRSTPLGADCNLHPPPHPPMTEAAWLQSSRYRITCLIKCRQWARLGTDFLCQHNHAWLQTPTAPRVAASLSLVLKLAGPSIRRQHHYHLFLAGSSIRLRVPSSHPWGFVAWFSNWRHQSKAAKQEINSEWRTVKLLHKFS